MLLLLLMTPLPQATGLLSLSQQLHSCSYPRLGYCSSGMCNTIMQWQFSVFNYDECAEGYCFQSQSLAPRYQFLAAKQYSQGILLEQKQEFFHQCVCKGAYYNKPCPQVFCCFNACNNFLKFKAARGYYNFSKALNPIPLREPVRNNFELMHFQQNTFGQNLVLTSVWWDVHLSHFFRTIASEISKCADLAFTRHYINYVSTKLCPNL